MYDVYIDKILLPITPAKITLKVKNQNKTVTLIDEGEINILKKAGLTDITLTALIPQVKYPFAKYKSGFQAASFFVDAFEKLKTSQQPFQFIVSRTMPNGKVLFDSNIKVSFEDYNVNEDSKNGFDLNVDIKLKQYRPYATKTVQITIQQEKPKAVVQPQRPAETAPKARTHTVVKGDCLWAIAQKYLGNGNRYPEIYSLNQAAIDARNKGTGNPKYTIYPNQVFTIPS
ncbi:peptidoglycan-binding protein [Clostridia bacterium]|nr:peptidoglycan-binding protein [Clostridia bacterium]